MSQGRRGKINYRCPHCLFRDIDFDLMYDKQSDQFYCLRCNWEGTESEILADYASYKLKYKDILKRYTVEDIAAKDEEEEDPDARPLHSTDPGRGLIRPSKMGRPILPPGGRSFQQKEPIETLNTGKGNS